MSDSELIPVTEEIDLTQDDSDSNTSSDTESEGEQENLQKISELEQQVEANPYMYEPHVQLINLLRKEGELDKLRNAREKMSQLFPLTEDLWIAWIQDEMSLASTDSDYENIHNLFERATKDYMSVDIWLEYGQFSIGRMNVKDGINIVRDVFERGITSVGLHVSKGAIIWEAFREFEIAMLSTLQADSEADLTPAQQDQIDLQRKRILSLFTRQLSVPLFDMEKTYEELREFNDNNVDQNLELSYQKAFDKLQKIQPYEDALISTIPPHLEEYKAYIDFETEADEPSRIQCIYERALVENCLTHELWLQYINYLESKLKIDSLSLPVLERSIRNCPWSVNLWQAYIVAMERYGQPHEKIKELVDRALGAGLTRAEEFCQLWLIYLEYLRRKIDWKNDHAIQLEELRNTFLRANRHLLDSFGPEGDANCNLLQFWARIEAYYCKDMTKARELWAEIMAQGHSSSAQMWLEYATLERACGDVKHLRKIFQKALQATQDWPEAIGVAWMNFERDEGTLEQWELAKMKIETKLQSVKIKRETEAQKEAEMQRYKKQQRKNKDAERKTMKQTVKTEEPIIITRKRKFPFTGSVGDSQNEASKSDIDKEGFKIPFSPAAKKNVIEEPPSKMQKEESFSNHGEIVKHDSAKDDVTIFISNLSYEVEEDKIREMFDQIGEIKEIRLVRDYRGRCKGFCYVEFGTLTAARDALKKDRELLDGRPMFVSQCEDRRKAPSQPKFKYKIGLEKNKLFVRGLPYTSTKDDLMEVFRNYGEVKDLRIVTFRNGRSKGLAFVEYIDEATAALALVKTDGMKIGDHTISVAISNPPERKSQGSGSGYSSQNIRSLGGGPKEVGIRGRGRTQVSFVPRTVHRASSTTTTVANGSSLNGVSKKKEETDTKPKTNEDFRKMFLNK